MSNPSSGLRFDVYERVHLPEDVAAIDELEEIELVPRIEIVQQGEQVLLKGHLLLTGVYRAPNEPHAEQALEHRIPVEITLPMNRVNRLDDISVEIDNFDVDLLSARTLNITGVLSLLGIEIEQPRPQEEWQPEEPFTVVHKREADEELEQRPERGEPALHPYPAETGGPPRFEGWTAPSTQAFRETLSRETAQREAAEREREAAQLQFEAQQREALEREREALQREAALREREAAELEAALRQEAQREAALRDAIERETLQREVLQREAEAKQAAQREAKRHEAELLDTSQGELYYQEPAAHYQEASREVEPLPRSFYQQEQEFHFNDEPAEDSTAANLFGAQQVYEGVTDSEAESSRKEMKVALNSKSQEAAEPSVGSVSFRSLLQSSRREQEARAAAEQTAQKAAEDASKSADDEIEWKNLFFGRAAEEQSFRRLRMCIVQREETLELIAGRYQLQAREIALYNRLPDQSVSEGQVLYIP